MITPEKDKFNSYNTKRSQTRIRWFEFHPKIVRPSVNSAGLEEFGLTRDERNEVYWSVAPWDSHPTGLVKQRLDKAASR